MLGVIALAHLGLFLLLTAAARRDVSALEARYGAGQLEAATDPGRAPRSGGPDQGRWNVRRRTWEDARTHRDRSRFVRLLGFGLLGSFLVQAGVLGVLLNRSVRSGRRR